MSHSYIAYIDESGDDGLKRFRQPGRDGGSSNWLVLGACVVRASRDLELVALRDQIKLECAVKTNGKAVHFKELAHNQRRKASQLLSGQPIRIVTVACRKSEIDPKVFHSKNLLYFYLTRYLIERVSWLCRDMRHIVKEGDGKTKIVFSRRGGMSYTDFKDYMHRLHDHEKTTIHWPIVDFGAVEAHDHSKLAGLQISDLCVSAVAAAFEPDRFGNVEIAYLKEFSKNLYKHNKKVLSYGLKVVPNSDSTKLDPRHATMQYISSL